MIFEKIFTLLQSKSFKIWRLHAFNQAETVRNKAYLINKVPIGETEFIDIDTLEPKYEYSLISTVYNESRTIENFLNSVLHQTYKPKEIVICDGCSSDNTVSLIKAWAEKNKSVFKVKLIEQTQRCLIAKGRNIAAAQAESEILVFGDAGTSLDKNWAERLVKGFVNEVDLVCGWYKPIADTELQKAFAWFVLPKLEVVDPGTFLPSGRSMAVRKAVFEKTGGFPEHLSFAGEDTLFDLNVKKNCRAVSFVPEAYCYWRVPATLPAMCKTIFRYAKGDGESGKLFWDYYILLMDKMAALFLHLAFLIASYILQNLIPAFSFLTIILIFGYLHRALIWAGSYGAFVNASLSEMFWRCVVLKFSLPAQLFGFISGVLNRKNLK